MTSNLIRHSLQLLMEVTLIQNIHSRITARIVHGSDVKYGAWPSQVILENRTAEDNESKIICGGTVISEQWILTAAHCIQYDKNGTLLAISDYLVILNEYDRNNTDGTEIVLHPSYNVISGAGADIALLKIDIPLNFSSEKAKNVLPICLDLRGINITGLECITTGYGKGLVDFPNVMQQITMNVMKSEECNKTLFSETNEQINNYQFCMVSSLAGTQNIGGPCFGDSGGPIHCKHKNRWFQIGVSESTTNCLQGPSIFEYVHKHADFIKQQTNYTLPQYCKIEENNKSTVNSSRISFVNFIVFRIFYLIVIINQ